MPERALHLVGQTVQAEAEASLDISENELIQALAEAQIDLEQDREGFLTMREMVAALDWPKARITANLHALHSQGRIETRKVVVVDIAGRRTRVPAYRLRAGG